MNEHYNNYPHLARRTQSIPSIVPRISTSDGLPKGVSTDFSVLPPKIWGSSSPEPPIIPTFTNKDELNDEHQTVFEITSLYYQQPNI